MWSLRWCIFTYVTFLPWLWILKGRRNRGGEHVMLTMMTFISSDTTLVWTLLKNWSSETQVFFPQIFRLSDFSNLCPKWLVDRDGTFILFRRKKTKKIRRDGKFSSEFVAIKQSLLRRRICCSSFSWIIFFQPASFQADRLTKLLITALKSRIYMCTTRRLEINTLLQMWSN